MRICGDKIFYFVRGKSGFVRDLGKGHAVGIQFQNLIFWGHNASFSFDLEWT